jgi:hypothetical protein
MNLKENLLVTVSEECSEISEAVSKTLRFGGPVNAYGIMYEFYQLCAMIEMCQDNGILLAMTDEDRDAIMSEKKQKVRMYQEVSRKNGTLKED